MRTDDGFDLPFRNRSEAGKLLAEALRGYRGVPGVVLLALPRGGVPVAFEVAIALQAPLDVFIVRKLGVPGHEELAMGAIASGGTRVLNEEVVRQLGISSYMIDSVAAREQQELERRETLYREGRPAPEIDGKVLILIDDGLATGATMLAGARALRQHNPRKLVVAVPVAPPSTCEEFRAEVDDIVCATMPTPFYGVGNWYEEFEQTTDAEVEELLARAARRVDAH